MRISVLASGSKGNCTYVETKTSSVLIDAGICRRNLSKKLSCIGKEINELDGIFITHEHTDHIKGLLQIDKKDEVPIFSNKATYNHLGFSLRKINFIDNETSIRDLSIKPVSVSHDAADPHGYLIRENGSSLGIFTDLGIPNNEVQDITRDADCMVLESNHDIDMVLNGRYPYHLKQRILGDKGHLSNIDAGLLVKNSTGPKLKSVFLAHLSQNNNTQELAYDTFRQITDERIETILTYQDKSTELRKI